MVSIDRAPGNSLARLKELSAVDGVIFDLDGTLWDASASATKAWNRALSKCGHSDHLVTIEELKAFTGIRIEIILEEKFAFMGKKGILEFLGVYRNMELEEMRKGGGALYPDVEIVVKTLFRTKRLFIVSNCLVGYIENFFHHSKLGPCFAGYESTGRTGRPKHENIRKVMNEHGVRMAVYGFILDGLCCSSILKAVGGCENAVRSCSLFDARCVVDSLHNSRRRAKTDANHPVSDDTSFSLVDPGSPYLSLEP